MATRPPAPPELMDVVSCQDNAEGKACVQANCSCFKAKLPCSSYRHCSASDECYNPLTKSKRGEQEHLHGEEEEEEEEEEFEDEEALSLIDNMMCIEFVVCPSLVSHITFLLLAVHVHL